MALNIYLLTAATLLSSQLMLGKCIPVPAVSSPVADDILRQFNVSREDLEATQRQQRLAAGAGSGGNQVAETLLGIIHHNPEALASSAATQQTIRNISSLVDNDKGSSAAIQRKQEVFRQVMGFVSQNGRPPILPTTINSSPSPRPDNAFSGSQINRVRYIQPSCDVPKHTEEEAWSSSSALHLFFNVTGIQNQARPGNQLYVVGAKLRLFKCAEGETSDTPGMCDEPGHFVQAETPVQQLQPTPFFEPSIITPDEEKVRVSVHNYTRALKRHRVHKKKLLDSQMAMSKEEGFMELDVKLAVRWWLTSGGRNYGLSLEVEDMDGQRKPASAFFRSRQCDVESGEPTDEVVDPAEITTPLLELTVVEVPEGRNVFELSSGGLNSRVDESESYNPAATLFEEFVDMDTEEIPRRHRQHSNTGRPHQHTAPEVEQADEALYQGVKQAVGRVPHGQTIRHGRPTPTPPSGSHRVRPAHLLTPIPTLATLEDHDLFKETEQEEQERAEADELRMLLHPSSTNIFMQRMMQSPTRSRSHKTI